MMPLSKSRKFEVELRTTIKSAFIKNDTKKERSKIFKRQEFCLQTQKDPRGSNCARGGGRYPPPRRGYDPYDRYDYDRPRYDDRRRYDDRDRYDDRRRYDDRDRRDRYDDRHYDDRRRY